MMKITAAMVVMAMMLVAGVSGEEDQRSGQRTALCHEGPEESYSERWKRRAEICDETEAINALKASVIDHFSQHVEKQTPYIQLTFSVTSIF